MMRQGRCRRAPATPRRMCDRFAAAALLLILSAAATAANPEGNLNVLFGQKRLADGDWHPVDSHAELGLLGDYRGPDWPAAVAADLLISGAEDNTERVTITGRTRELALGIRRSFSIPGFPFRPVVGGGINHVWATVKAESAADSARHSGRGVGYWLSAGSYLRLAERWNLGGRLRFSQTEVDLSGETVKAGGRHFGLFVGFHW